MRAACLVAALALAPGVRAQGSTAPAYAADGVVNAITYTTEAMAPNTPVSIFGARLAWGTATAGEDHVRAGELPWNLAGVQVFVSGLRAHLFFASEKQVNFLVPASLRPGNYEVWIARDGMAGPKVPITLAEVAPAFIVAAHTDGSLVNEGAPAKPGEVLVIYATGLGRTDPDLANGQIPAFAFPIRRRADLKILLNDAALDDAAILYAGVTPGFAGLYQINVRLPAELPGECALRAAIGERASAPLKVAAR